MKIGVIIGIIIDLIKLLIDYIKMKKGEASFANIHIDTAEIECYDGTIYLCKNITHFCFNEREKNIMLKGEWGQIDILIEEIAKFNMSSIKKPVSIVKKNIIILGNSQ